MYNMVKVAVGISAGPRLAPLQSSDSDEIQHRAFWHHTLGEMRARSALSSMPPHCQFEGLH